MNPLDQLADIQTPSEVSIWPLAWGYWALLIVILLVLSVVTYWLLNRIRYTAAKRISLKKIDRMDTADLDFIHQIQTVLKLHIAHYHPAVNAPVLQGSAWQNYLVANYKGKNKQAIKQACTHIYSSLYQTTLNGQDSKSQTNKNQQTKLAIIDWINTSTPQKNSAKMVEHAYV